MKNNVATNQVISANLLLGCVVGGDYEDYNGLLIPVYQRNYTWEKKEIEELYDDFENHWNRNCKKEADGDFYMNDSSRRYYLGNVVVVKERGEKFGILDGQQRITTLYIMNAVFKAFFKKLREELNVLHIANKISLDKNAELKQEFKSYLESVNK